MLVGILLALVSLASAAFVHHFMLLSLTLEANGKRVPAVRGWIPYVGCVTLFHSRRLQAKKEKKRPSSSLAFVVRFPTHSFTCASPLYDVRSCALDFVSNPSKFFEDCRKKHGDTFVIYVFGVRMLCTFSPEVIASIQHRTRFSVLCRLRRARLARWFPLIAKNKERVCPPFQLTLAVIAPLDPTQGVSSLYKLREREASFTQATKGLLSLKVPPEVGRDGVSFRRPLILRAPSLTAHARPVISFWRRTTCGSFTADSRHGCCPFMCATLSTHWMRAWSSCPRRASRPCSRLSRAWCTASAWRAGWAPLPSNPSEAISRRGWVEGRQSRALSFGGREITNSRRRLSILHPSSGTFRKW